MTDAAYITMDLETGGIGTDCSLLTAYFGVLDKDMNLLDSLDLKVKPNEGKPYVVHAQGMSVNKIDLIEHDKTALSESEAGGQTFAFLKKHSNSGKVKLIPVGHNVQFDILFIYEHLLQKKHFDQFVSYRKIDTGTIAQFLKYCGLIEPTNTGSLEYLADLYKVKFLDRAHTAESDAMMCVEILKEMKKHVAR
jgi:DNA polymerase III alpha subunit (gram-positive type)